MYKKTALCIQGSVRYSYLSTNESTSERMRNNVAEIVVILESIASIVLALFLPKNVSAPPEIAPERPALLPCCIRTEIINTIARIT